MAQIRGVLRLELRKGLLGRRALPVYFIGLLPVGVAFFFILVSTLVGGAPAEFRGPQGAHLFFIAQFQFILRFVLFVGCVWIFMNLFRGEVIDRSLHYYFLTPIRRDVLVAGKYLAAWVTSSVVFGGATALCYVALHAYLGGASSALSGPVLAVLFQYVGVVLLGCLGYGALFLVIGLYLRSLIVPALLVFAWESLNTFLPAFLKKISVVFYLQGLIPLPPPDGPISILAEPVSVWIALPGILVFTAITLVAAGFRIRRVEISYAAE